MKTSAFLARAFPSNLIIRYFYLIPLVLTDEYFSFRIFRELLDIRLAPFPIHLLQCFAVFTPKQEIASNGA